MINQTLASKSFTAAVTPAAVSVLLLLTISILGAATATAQFRNISLVQGRIRERMIREQGGNRPSVTFNDDGNFQSLNGNETRVRGTGNYFRDQYDRGRWFSYDAVFNVRSSELRSLNYSFNNDGGGNNNNGEGGTIYCGSEDGRRRECVANTRRGVRLVTQRSGAECIQGRTWGFSRNYIWVDRGCRADFEVGEGGGGGDYYSPGSVTWRGRVDHDVQLVLSGSEFNTYVLSGKDLGVGTYTGSQRLPRNATVSVRRIRGRNDVSVTQQPSRDNGYQAVIHITDRRGGSDQCEIVISW